MDRSGVRRLLGIEPARIHIVDAEVSATGPWEGISRSRVLLRASDGHTIPCLLQEPEHLSTPLPVVAIHQHNDEFHLGKSEPAGMAGNPDMAYGLALAKAGVTTLIPDLPGVRGATRPLRRRRTRRTVPRMEPHRPRHHPARGTRHRRLPGHRLDPPAHRRRFVRRDRTLARRPGQLFLDGVR